MSKKDTEEITFTCPHCGRSMTGTSEWMQTVNFCGWCGKPMNKDN